MQNVVFRRKILYIAQKQKFGYAGHAHKLLPFPVTSELGLENYPSYPCTYFGESL